LLLIFSDDFEDYADLLQSDGEEEEEYSITICYLLSVMILRIMLICFNLTVRRRRNIPLTFVFYFQ
jgi:hypothetical protein